MQSHVVHYYYHSYQVARATLAREKHRNDLSPDARAKRILTQEHICKAWYQDYVRILTEPRS